jgi:hypothetical protein
MGLDALRLLLAELLAAEMLYSIAKNVEKSVNKQKMERRSLLTGDEEKVRGDLLSKSLEIKIKKCPGAEMLLIKKLEYSDYE